MCPHLGSMMYFQFKWPVHWVKSEKITPVIEFTKTDNSNFTYSRSNVFCARLFLKIS